VRTPRPVRRFELRDLGAEQLVEINAGAHGRIFAVPEFELFGGPMVFKRYGSETLAAIDATTLGAMVSFAATMPRGRAQWLWSRAAWPAALVMGEDRVLGFLMREVPGNFRLRIRTGRLRQTKLAGMEYLLNPDEFLARMEVPVNDRLRLELLLDVSRTLAGLHSLGIAVGDLSPKNLLFTGWPRPACFFVDCDSMRMAGRSALPQTETPDWEIPSGHVEELGTPATDAYKLGLLAVRLFARDQTSRSVGPLAGVSPELGRLAYRTLSHRPSDRPPPAHWIGALERILLSPGSSSAARPPDGARARAPNRRRRRKAETAMLLMFALLVFVWSVLFVCLGLNPTR
jgi:hypothetical protein